MQRRPLFILYFDPMKAPVLDPIKTVLTITLGFLLLYYITKLDYFIYISFLIGISGLLSSFLARQITWLWSRFSWMLSFIVPNILLSIVFYLILFPLALLSKIFGASDPLFLKKPKHSLFKERKKEFTSDSFTKPW